MSARFIFLLLFVIQYEAMRRHEIPALVLFILHSHSARSSSLFFPHFLLALIHFHRSFYHRTKQERIEEHAIKAKQFYVLFRTRWKCHEYCECMYWRISIYRGQKNGHLTRNQVTAEK